MTVALAHGGVLAIVAADYLLAKALGGTSTMGWCRTTALGENAVELRFSRSGRFNRHIDGGLADERLRVSGRHFRIVMRRKTWDDLSDDERDARLHDRA
jgi:hypothetical protein